MPRKFASYYIALRLFLLFLSLFSLTQRSLKTNSWCFACYMSSFAAPCSPQQGSCSQCVLEHRVRSVCPPQLQLELCPALTRSCRHSPASPASLSLCAVTPVSSAAKTSFLQLQPWSLFSLMVFLLFCLTCFCSSQQGLFVILMSSLCRYSSFPSHVHFSTWVERFRDIFCNSVLAFHCGPECLSSLVLIVTNPSALLLCNAKILHKSPCL